MEKKDETQKNIIFQLLIFQGRSLKTQETHRNFAGEINQLWRLWRWIQGASKMLSVILKILKTNRIPT